MLKKIRDLRYDVDLIVIDQSPQTDYLPNGLNKLYRQDITNLKEAHWASTLNSNYPPLSYLLGQVTRIDNHLKQVTVIDDHGQKQLIAYDSLVCAMGSHGQSSVIKGSNHPQVLTTKSFKDSIAAHKLVQDAQKVLVIGAGLIGLDMADSLSRIGKEVTLIEAADQVDSYQSDQDMVEPLLDAINECGIHLITNQRVKAIVETDNGQLRVETGDSYSWQGDLVFLAINFRPTSDLLSDQVECSLDRTVIVNDHFQTSDPDIYAIGDLIASPLTVLDSTYYFPLISHAIKTGQALAYHLSGISVPKISHSRLVGAHHFGYFRSRVGLTVEEASFYDKVYSVTYQSQLSESFDSPLRIKLIAKKSDGTLLGAQLLSKENHLLLTNQLSQAIFSQLKDQDLASQDFIFSLDDCPLAFHLHQAAIQLFEKRASL